MVNVLKILIVWIVLLLLSTTTATAARIYRWTDENDGAIHFSPCFPGKPDCLPDSKPRGKVELIFEGDVPPVEISKIEDPFEIAEAIVRRSRPDSKGEYHKRVVVRGWVASIDFYPSRSVLRLTTTIPKENIAESFVRYKYESFIDKFDINTGRYTTVPIIHELYTRETWGLSAMEDIPSLGIKKGEPAILHELSLSKAESIAFINTLWIMKVLIAERDKK